MSLQEEDVLKSSDSSSNSQDVIITKSDRKRAQILIGQNENEVDMVAKRLRMTPMHDIPEVVEDTSAHILIPPKDNKDDKSQDSSDNSSDYFLADEEFEGYPAGNNDTIFQDIHDQDDDDDLLPPIPGGFWHKNFSGSTSKSINNVKQRIIIQDDTTMTIEQPQKPQEGHQQIGTSTPHSDPEKPSENSSSSLMQESNLSIDMSQPQAKVTHHRINPDLSTKAQKDVATSSTVNKVEIKKKVQEKVHEVQKKAHEKAQEKAQEKAKEKAQEKAQEKAKEKAKKKAKEKAKEKVHEVQKKAQEKIHDKDSNTIKVSLDQTIAVAPRKAGEVMTSMQESRKSSSSKQPTSGQSVKVIPVRSGHPTASKIQPENVKDETLRCQSMLEYSIRERTLNEFDKDIVKFKSFNRSIGKEFISQTPTEKEKIFELGSNQATFDFPRFAFPKRCPPDLVRKAVAKVMEDNGSEVTKAGSDSCNHNMQDMKDFANLFITNMNYRKYCESETSFGGIINALLDNKFNYMESLEAVVIQNPSPTSEDFLSHHNKGRFDVSLERWLMSWVLLMLKKGKHEYLQENENICSKRMIIAVPHQFVQVFRLCHGIEVAREDQEWSPIFYPLDNVDSKMDIKERAIWITKDLVLQIISPSIYKALGGLRPFLGKGVEKELDPSNESNQKTIIMGRPKTEKEKVVKFQRLFKKGFITRKLRSDPKINLEILRSGLDKEQELYSQIRINVWIHMGIFNIFVEYGCVPALLLKNIQVYFKTPSSISESMKYFVENEPAINFFTVYRNKAVQFVNRIRWILGEERMSILSSYLEDGLQWYQQNHNGQRSELSLSIDSQKETPSAGPSKTMTGKNTTSKPNTTPKQNDRIQTQSDPAKKTNDEAQKIVNVAQSIPTK